MRITDINAIPVSIPLDEPVAFATQVVEERDHAVVYVKTDEGIEGVGYTLGYGGAELITTAVEDLLAPLIIDEDPNDTEKIWREMFDSTVQIGRKGVLLRAISIIDIALWDIKAKFANQPLYKLLGANSEKVPAYASGGYYREGKELDGLQEELKRYQNRGHDTFKIKVGGESLEKDIERVQLARETIGEEATLLLDANGKWDHKWEAVNACKKFEPYNPFFIEEPVMPDSISLMKSINETLDYPVAAGELEFSRYGFVELMREGAVDIIQPDVTVVGGITEWMRVAHTAASYDIPVAPHYNWDLHVQVLGAIENGLWAEFFHRDSDVKVFDDMIKHPLEPENGFLELPDRPGHGVELEKESLNEFQITNNN